MRGCRLPTRFARPELPRRSDPLEGIVRSRLLERLLAAEGDRLGSSQQAQLSYDNAGLTGVTLPNGITLVINAPSPDSMVAAALSFWILVAARVDAHSPKKWRVSR
jgi:hypothetical protein